MNTLAELLDFVVSTLQALPLCRSTRIVETDEFSELQYALKVRAELINGDTLQVRLYRNDTHIDYAYQLIRNGEPLMRWDNKEHFSEILTQPHHFHDPEGSVQPSSLNGDPSNDLPLVLNAISRL